jgi:uncharacterized protein YqgV (UPF0045/DUF77 family)
MKVYGTKLSTYVNNLFTTCDDMETALSQAALIAGGADNAAAVHTAVHMVLNTAIKLHQADMAAANAPLRELIEAEIQKAFTAVHSSVEVALENHSHEITRQIDEAIDDIDLDQKVQDWMDNNFDIESALSGTCVSITFD